MSTINPFTTWLTEAHKRVIHAIVGYEMFGPDIIRQSHTTIIAIPYRYRGLSSDFITRSVYSNKCESCNLPVESPINYQAMWDQQIDSICRFVICAQCERDVKSQIDQIQQHITSLKCDMLGKVQSTNITITYCVVCKYNKKVECLPVGAQQACKQHIVQSRIQRYATAFILAQHAFCEPQLRDPLSCVLTLFIKLIW